MTTRGVLACLALAACAANAWAQPPVRPPGQPTFRTATLLTELDVLPIGPDGTVATGLTANDFEVVEDGEAQRVDSVEFVDVDAVEAERLPPGVVSNATRTSSRVWVLVVDDLRLGRVFEDPVRSTLSTLVDELSPGDYVALVPTSGRLDRRAEFTLDKHVVREAVGRLRFSEVGTGRFATGLHRQLAPGMIDLAADRGPGLDVGDRASTSQLGHSPGDMASPDPDAEAGDDRLLTTLRDVSVMVGRTSAARVLVVLVSTGMGVSLHPDALITVPPGPPLIGGSSWSPVANQAARTVEAHHLLGAMQRGGAKVYAVNPLQLEQVWRERLIARTSQTDARERLLAWDRQINPAPGSPYSFLGGLAAATGGRAFTGLLDPKAVARSLRDDSGRYYLVRYYPTRQDRDDTLRTIEVRVRRPGVTTRAATRYAVEVSKDYATSGDSLTRTLGEVLPRHDVPLVAKAEVAPARKPGGPARIRLSVRLRPGAADWQPGDAYEVLAAAVDARGAIRASARGRFDARDGTPDAPRGTVVLLEDLPPGRYQCRLVVRDVRSDTAGSIFLDVEVPAP